MATKTQKPDKSLGGRMGVKYGNTGGGCEELNQEVYLIGLSDADRNKINRDLQRERTQYPRQKGIPAEAPKAQEYTYKNNKGQAPQLAKKQALKSGVNVSTVRYTNGKQTEEHIYINLGGSSSEMGRARRNLTRMDNQNKALAKKGQTKRYRNKTELIVGTSEAHYQGKAQLIDKINYLMLCVTGKTMMINLQYNSPAMQKRAKAHKAKTGSKKGAPQSCGPPITPNYCYCASQKKYSEIYKELDYYINHKDMVPFEGLVFSSAADVRKAIKKREFKTLKGKNVEDKHGKDFFIVWEKECPNKNKK